MFSYAHKIVKSNMLTFSKSFNYASHTHFLTPPPDDTPYDLFLTKPFESTRTAVRMPNPGSIFMKPSRWIPPAKPQAAAAGRSQESKSSQQSGKASGSSEMDSDLEALQNGYAAHEAAVERCAPSCSSVYGAETNSDDRIKVVGNLPTTKNGNVKARGKGKLLSGHSRSVSASGSPAIGAIGSPSIPALSASDQAIERSKELRVALVHVLAAKERTTDYLSTVWQGRDSEFRPTLEKTADYNDDKKAWELKKIFWKELDVWKYPYDTQEEREQAIKNATRQYDRQRLSASDPIWQKLLVEEERNKGKCLSQLQANIAKGPPQPPPKVKVSPADGVSNDDADRVRHDKSKLGGEKMVRSSSSSMPPKPKFGSTSSTAKKPTTGNTIKAKPVPKPSPTKAKVVTSKVNDGRGVLSKEIIENSDSSEDDARPMKSKHSSHSAPKVADTVIVKPRVANPPQRSAPPPSRAVEDDDSSSSSGTPLAKRLTQKSGRPLPPMKKKAIDPIRDSKASTNSAPKNKNTSPTKSSPLASSPPTNVSDMSDETPPPPPLKKRKAEHDMRDSAHVKRHARNMSVEVLDKAQKFKRSYEKYKALHHEIAALDSPPKEKMQRLLHMRDHLEGMKKEIYTQYHSDRESG